MIFAIFCTDRPGTAELRRRTRPVHRDWLHASHAKVKLLMSGATLESDGKTMNVTSQRGTNPPTEMVYEKK